MGALGVHFSFPPELSEQLRDGDEAARAFVEALEDAWDRYYLQETDKAWDAIHRCLSDGTLEWGGGEWPLNGAVLGGEPVYGGRDFVIVFLDPADVAEVAAALDQVTQPWFRARFSVLAQHGYKGSLDEPSFDYTWHWFELMRAFFRKTGDEGRAVVFTAEQ